MLPSCLDIKNYCIFINTFFNDGCNFCVVHGSYERVWVRFCSSLSTFILPISYVLNFCLINTYASLIRFHSKLSSYCAAYNADVRSPRTGVVMLRKREKTFHLSTRWTTIIGLDIDGRKDGDATIISLFIGRKMSNRNSSAFQFPTSAAVT